MSDPADLSREELIACGQAQEVRIAELTGALEQVRGAHAELTATLCERRAAKRQDTHQDPQAIQHSDHASRRKK